MNLVDVLNTWGAAWSGFMVRAFIDSSVLLALIVVVWLPMRRRMSAQLRTACSAWSFEVDRAGPGHVGVVATLGVGPASDRAGIGVGEFRRAAVPTDVGAAAALPLPLTGDVGRAPDVGAAARRDRRAAPRPLGLRGLHLNG